MTPTSMSDGSLKPPMSRLEARMRLLARDVALAKFDATFCAAVLARRGRATHKKGVAARGELEVAPFVALPESDLFAPGRRFHAVLRHGNVSLDDDASMDIRGAALRLVDDPGTRPTCEGPGKPLRMDLLMNTGEVAFSSANDFLAFAIASGPKPGARGPVDTEGLRRLLEASPRMRAQFTAGLRRAPSSFARLRYHTQMPLRFHAKDGVERYARFRLVPASGSDHDACDLLPEEGIPSDRDLRAPWLQDRVVGETRAFGYLREELRRRVCRGGAAYALEVQLYAPGPRGVDRAKLDPGTAWDEAAHPFVRVGELRLTTPLGEQKTEELRFNVANLPDELALLPCLSLDDEGSIGFVRAHVYAVTQRLRRRLARAERLLDLRAQLRKRAFRSRKHETRPDKRRDSSLVHLVFGHVWRG